MVTDKTAHLPRLSLRAEIRQFVIDKSGDGAWDHPSPPGLRIRSWIQSESVISLKSDWLISGQVVVGVGKTMPTRRPAGKAGESLLADVRRFPV